MSESQQPPTQAQIEASKMMVPIVKFWVEVMGHDHKEQPRALEIVSYLDGKGIYVDTSAALDDEGAALVFKTIVRILGKKDHMVGEYSSRKQATMHGILKAISIYNEQEV